MAAKSSEAEGLMAERDSALAHSKRLEEALKWAYTDVHAAAMNAIKEGAPESDTRRMSLKIISEALANGGGS